MADPRWRQFEQAIQDIFERNPRAKVARDAVVKGSSGRERKLELLVEYPFEIPFAEGFVAHVPIRIAVDCKHHERKVGIKKVEEFAGQMDDVGAPVGIMVAANGFDDGAKARAEQLNIYLINAPWDLLALAKGIGAPPRFYECSACSEARAGKDCFGGMVGWVFAASQHDPAWGNCDWCNAPHAMCPDCGEITGFMEADYGDWIECAGGCGRVYKVTYDVRDACHHAETISGVQRMILLEASATATLRTERVQAILAMTKWHYAKSGDYDPILEMQDKGWVLKVDEGLLLDERASELVEEELANARDAYYW